MMRDVLKFPWEKVPVLFVPRVNRVVAKKKRRRQKLILVMLERFSYAIDNDGVGSDAWVQNVRGNVQNASSEASFFPFYYCEERIRRTGDTRYMGDDGILRDERRNDGDVALRIFLQQKFDRFVESRQIHGGWSPRRAPTENVAGVVSRRSAQSEASRIARSKHGSGGRTRCRTGAGAAILQLDVRGR